MGPHGTQKDQGRSEPTESRHCGRGKNHPKTFRASVMAACLRVKTSGKSPCASFQFGLILPGKLCEDVRFCLSSKCNPFKNKLRRWLPRHCEHTTTSEPRLHGSLRLPPRCMASPANRVRKNPALTSRLPDSRCSKLASDRTDDLFYVEINCGPSGSV